MIKKILLALLLIFPFVSKANDCVPLTFEAVSIYIGQPVEYKIWYNSLMPKGKPFEMPVCISAWNVLHPKNQLLCVWVVPTVNADPLIVLDLSNHLKEKRLYIWVGEEVKDYIDDQHNGVNCHMAMVFFDRHKAILISKTKPNNVDSSAMIVQELDMKDFWNMTLFLFQVSNDPKADMFDVP